jgi:hypothetical protein
MSYAKQKFRNLLRILSRNIGTLSDRILMAFMEVLPCRKQDYPSPEFYEEFAHLRSEVTTEPWDRRCLNETIGKMTQAQRERMRDRLLDLAQRLEQSTGLGESA